MSIDEDGSNPVLPSSTILSTLFRLHNGNEYDLVTSLGLLERVCGSGISTHSSWNLTTLSDTVSVGDVPMVNAELDNMAGKVYV
jgi:hypothetical protein